MIRLGKSIKNRISRALLVVFAVIMGLVILLYLLVQLPFFQTFVVRKAASYLSEEMGTTVSIDRLRITGFRSINLTGLTILDERQDTLLYSGHTHVALKRLSPGKSYFELNKVSLEETYLRLVTYEGDSVMNLQYLLDYFSGGEKTGEAVSPTIICHQLSAKGLTFTLDDMNMPGASAGMDYSHLGISDIQLVAEEISYSDDSLKVRIESLAAREKCGLTLESFESDVVVADGLISAENLFLKTQQTSLDMDLAFTFADFNAFSYFIDSVRISAGIRNSDLNMADVGFFAPALLEMKNQFGLSGEVSGTVSNIRAKNLSLSYNQNTRFMGQVRISGLPDFDNTFLNVSVENLESCANDIKSINLPGDEKIDLPSQLEMAGDFRIKGKFTGFYYDFVSYASFRSDLGRVNTDITLKMTDEGDFVYSGKLSARKFNLGKLIPDNQMLGKLDFNASLQGSGLTFEEADIVMDGRIDSLEFSGNVFNSMLISGSLRDMAFEGNLAVIDDVVGLDFDGRIDFGSAIPKYNFTALIRDAKPHDINLFEVDSSLRLSTRLDINFMGTRPDDMQGIIKVDSTFCSYQGKEYFMKNLTASITGDSTEYRVFRVFSDFVDASAEGKMVIRDLWPSLLKTFDTYLDTLIVSWDSLAARSTQNFVFDISLKSTDVLSDMLMPQLRLAEGGRITGLYNSINNDLKINCTSSQIDYQNMKFTGWNLSAGTKPDKGMFTMKSDRLYFSDTLNIDSLSITAGIDNDSILFSSTWKNPYLKEKGRGEITGYIDFVNYHRYKIKLSKANLYIGEHKWGIGRENMIVIDTSFVSASKFDFKSEKEMISINGVVSENPEDSLRVAFLDFNISNLDFILSNINLDFDGTVNGSTVVTGLYDSPNLISDIRVDSFCFNGEKMGDAEFVTGWDKSKSLLNLKADIIYTGNIGQKKILGLRGKFIPDSKTNNYDIDIELDNYKLITLEPFLSSFTSSFSGQASGNIHMSGKTEEPVFTGDISLIHTRMKIDYLNVTYYFADKIILEKDKLYFNNIVLYDSLNNQGLLSGTIDFGNFSNLSLDLTIRPDNLACLNTNGSMNEQFYGKARASGEIRISGPVDNLLIDIAATSGKETRVVIPVSTAVDLTHDYIVFIKNDSLSDDKSGEKTREISGVRMNFDLNVTPDAEIQIILPYRTGWIKSEGAGEIKMNIDPGGAFTMDGEYNIRKGSLFLTMQNILNRLFDISKGGRIWWTGDPYDANVNLRAVYKVKTTLGEYAPGADSATRVPVDCVIALNGKLFDPQFRFIVEFPDLSEDAKQYIYARLDTTDQAVMNQQMVSLLVLNSFSMGASTSSGVGFNTFSLLSNQINNLLSRISKDVDIGINYRPGDEISQHEVELALSTQLFDDRVSIDGNVGVKGDQGNATTQNTNNIVGEVTVEVKITRDGRFRVKAFNKANNSYLYKNYSPYTQGVGIFFTQEFNKLSDLRRSKKKKEVKEVLRE